LKVMLTPDYPPGLCNISQGWKAGQYRAGHMQGLTNGAVNPAQTFLWGQANMPLDDTRVEVRKTAHNGAST